MERFRFQNLEIWHLAIALADRAFDIADALEKKQLYRFAEQLRGCSMSMSNNIAEGSGSISNREFARFLDIARKSAFETANILILLYRRNLIQQQAQDSLLDELNQLCGSMTNFKKRLFNANAKTRGHSADSQEPPNPKPSALGPQPSALTPQRECL